MEYKGVSVFNFLFVSYWEIVWSYTIWKFNKEQHYCLNVFRMLTGAGLWESWFHKVKLS